MRRRLNQIARGQRGFSLIELLVVILIIGILVAIALPVYLGQQKKAHDSDAKSAARNLVEQVESCYTNTQDFTKCELGADGKVGESETGLQPGSGEGQVEETTTMTEYTVVAHSKSGTAFTVEKIGSGALKRTCSDPGTGACPQTGKW